ncbi:UvrD-helicase domain-containing protein [Ruegeria sp. HKCCD7221]|uniref:UvrD-helicase domain-containing protein n=1 Tax=Ruegeria sp. HKCCD7221 TaxID=2683009 RepID=UPI001489293E|nr:UvrD-helicase domain-containing protein [Ruegeria sp. HKCCD7221]
MTVVISDSFTKALSRLSGDEQKQIKITTFDIQTNPENPGLSLHRVDRARDPNFWTARVSRDIRIVLHKKDGSTLLAWVGHHDDAYAWAERRRVEAHPKTGAAQIVELRERVEDVVIQRYVEEAVKKPPIFARESDEKLLSWGVPEDWLETVRTATEDTVLDIAGHLPSEASEALLCAAVGEPPVVRLVEQGSDPYAHPDAQRRFRVLDGENELEAALEAPWDDWAVFLHPAQQEFVDRDFNGPARVIGSAGTGKTVVAIHRAVRLARENEEARVLVATFNENLAKDLRQKIKRLTRGRRDIDERIDVATVEEVAKRLGIARLGDMSIASEQEVEAQIGRAIEQTGCTIDRGFLQEEWRLIVDAWNVTDAETYQDLPRLGRKIRMAQGRRDEAWQVFGKVREWLSSTNKLTVSGLLYELSQNMASPPYDNIVIDEAQDISVPELRLIAAIAGNKPNGLFFAGDIGQRIFRSPFPWKAAGVDIRGRSRSLKVNYRTSHQIRSKSDLLLPSRLLEADGGEDRRLGVTSVFHGPKPALQRFDEIEAETKAANQWVKELVNEGLAKNEIAVLVRDHSLSERAAAVTADLAGVDWYIMHEAKGREFRAVAIIGCEADVIPSESRLALASDERALEEIYDTERHLLYVAATRARDHLWISGVGEVSEFLEDLIS